MTRKTRQIAETLLIVSKVPLGFDGFFFTWLWNDCKVRELPNQTQHSSLLVF